MMLLLADCDACDALWRCVYAAGFCSSSAHHALSINVWRRRQQRRKSWQQHALRWHSRQNASEIIAQC
jgi:hypothetical protein